MNSTNGNPPGLFISGTDTGVGKTRVSTWIVRYLTAKGLRVGVCKPAVTGAVVSSNENPDDWRWGDLDALRKSCSLDVPDSLIAPFRWREPLAPSIAAQRDPMGPRPSIDDYLAALDAWTGRCDFLVVEGVGGLLCPLTETETVADLAKKWGRPVLLVARSGLGTLNHTLLSVEAAQARGISLAGVLLNRAEQQVDELAEQCNPAELRRLTPLPVWGPLPYSPDEVDFPQGLHSLDWSLLAGLSTHENVSVDADSAPVVEMPPEDSGIHPAATPAAAESTSSSNIFGSSVEPAAPPIQETAAPAASSSSSIFGAASTTEKPITPASGVRFDAPVGESTSDGWGAASSASDQTTASLPMETAAPRGSLLPLFLFTWASLATMLAGWLLWNWPETRSPLEDMPEDAKASADIVSPLERLSSRELCRLGETIVVGDLEVAPTRIEVKPLTILPGGMKTDPALVLHLKLTNRSESRSLRPLDPVFLYPDPRKKLRGLPMFDQSGYTYTFAHPRGKPESVILPYDLGQDQSLKVDGQVFPLLKPGESAEAIVVSEEDAAKRLTTEMVWRIKLRKRTTQAGQSTAAVVGVLFSKDDVQTPSAGG